MAEGQFLVRPAMLRLHALEPIPTKDFEGEPGAVKLNGKVLALMRAALKKLRAGEIAGKLRRHGILTHAAAASVALIIAGLIGVSIYVQNWCIAQPPDFEYTGTLTALKVTERDGVRKLGYN